MDRGEIKMELYFWLMIGGILAVWIIGMGIGQRTIDKENKEREEKE